MKTNYVFLDCDLKHTLIFDDASLDTDSHLRIRCDESF